MHEWKEWIVNKFISISGGKPRKGSESKNGSKVAVK